MAEEKGQSTIVFMGTPPFAATILQKLASWPHGQLLGVFTQPDRPAKRGQKNLPSAVKLQAEELNIPIYQPKSLKGDADFATLAALKPDFLLVAAYGLLLPKRVLSLPKYPPLNVHASLLPSYRGAAPIERAIMDGIAPNAKTGISIMEMVEALDAGPVYATAEILLGEQTADELLSNLAPLGADLLLKVLEQMLNGQAQKTPQDDSLATYAAKLSKNDGVINFKASAAKVHAQIRAVTSKPGAQVTLAFPQIDKTFELKILPGQIEPKATNSAPGLVYLDKDSLKIACADFWYKLSQVKPKGKAFMPVKAFINGYLNNLPASLEAGQVIYPNAD